MTLVSALVPQGALVYQLAEVRTRFWLIGVYHQKTVRGRVPTIAARYLAVETVGQVTPAGQVFAVEQTDISWLELEVIGASHGDISREEQERSETNIQEVS